MAIFFVDFMAGFHGTRVALKGIHIVNDTEVITNKMVCKKKIMKFWVNEIELSI